ncbi:hypothetical protein [Agrococcus sp. SCSIO52902]|uniref:hypothetical protein n=1 Tax=Agrococcus sp. SCSIO52902 TaxID=2933290 RepID=UPI001FF353A6|nr:hypothetical protein [Agrococcus sp. SCSIO52902]UOW00899.1 hypothetical protein MU522_00250 [Agrococcus sp. SCSIO52902]
MISGQRSSSAVRCREKSVWLWLGPSAPSVRRLTPRGFARSDHGRSMGYSPRLRVTRRCLKDDLGLDEALAERDARAYCDRHEAIRRFTIKRAGAPGEGENMLNVRPYGHVKTIHFGQARGLTIFDPATDTCWLLAYDATHAVGERRDGYARFEQLDARGELLPTANDYELLESLSSVVLLDAIRSEGRGLYAEARANAGDEVCRTFEFGDQGDAQVMAVIDLVVIEREESEQGWMSVVVPPETPLSHEQLLDVVAELIPSDIDETTLELAGDFNGRVPSRNELVFTWTKY